MGVSKVFTPQVTNWRWYADNRADPIEGDSLAAESTAPVLANLTDKLRLRLQINCAGARSTNLFLYTVEYSTDQYNWYSLDSANSDFNWADGQDTDGDIVTDLLLTNSAEKNECVESAYSYVQDMEAFDKWEFDLCIVPDAAEAAAGTTYYFRFYFYEDNDGSVYSELSQPSLVTPSAGIQVLRRRREGY